MKDQNSHHERRHFMAFDDKGFPVDGAYGRTEEVVRNRLYDLYGSNLMTVARSRGGPGYVIAEIKVPERLDRFSVPYLRAVDRTKRR